MLTESVSATTGGMAAGQWAGGFGSGPLPPSTNDLLLFVAVILFMVFTATLAAVFVRDKRPAKPEMWGEAHPPRETSSPVSAAAEWLTTRRRGRLGVSTHQG